MNENKIIHFLEFCGSDHSDAIELIQSKNAEIERLREKIERAKEAMDMIIAEVGEAKQLYIKDIARAKSEAIKEFAERLKTETFLAKAKGSVEHVLWIDEIDKLVKEMGESE